MMNWFRQLFVGGNRKAMRKSTMMMSLLALAGSVVAYGAVRRRGRGNAMQTMMQPLRNRLFR